MNRTIWSETSTINTPMATQAPALHSGVAESAVCRRRARGHDSCSGIEGASCQAVDTDVPLNLPLETGTAKGMLNPCHAQGKHNIDVV